jgi:hypothetical protein
MGPPPSPGRERPQERRVARKLAPWRDFHALDGVSQRRGLSCLLPDRVRYVRAIALETVQEALPHHEGPRALDGPIKLLVRIKET